MKFRVSDDQKSRHQNIRSYLEGDSASIAVVFSAIDLEWTIRRVLDKIIGSSKISEVKQIAGLNAYEKAWNEFAIPKGFPKLSFINPKWNEIKKDYQLRHDIVHGRVGTTSAKYADQRVNDLLGASVAITEAASKQGFNPYRKLKKANFAGPTKKGDHQPSEE